MFVDLCMRKVVGSTAYMMCAYTTMTWALYLYTRHDLHDVDGMEL